MASQFAKKPATEKGAQGEEGVKLFKIRITLTSRNVKALESGMYPRTSFVFHHLVCATI
jgi:hypothetical protein